MTGWRKAFFGAVTGALLTLLVNPISRPYIGGAVLGPSQATLQKFQPGAEKPTQPTTIIEAAHWLQFAAHRMANRTAFSPKEKESLRLVIAEGQRKDPTNAFWPQMSALFFRSAGDERSARRAWMEGIRKQGWNDYQSDYLLRELSLLTTATREEQSWQLAYLYQQRSMAMVRLVESLARSMVSQADFVTKDSLDIRYATVVNGALIRRGSRNVAVGQIGAFIVELGAYPADLAVQRSPRRLLLGENDLFNNLISIGKAEWARQVQQEFKENEGWQAFASAQQAEDQARDFSLLSSVLAVLPGAIIAVGLVGGVILGIGELCGRYFRGRTFSWALPCTAGVALGAVVYALTSFAVASVACSLCGVFLIVSPKQQRAMKRRDFGPTFSVVMGLLAIAAGVCLGAYIVGVSGPASAILSGLSIPAEYFGGSPLFIGLFVLFISMIFLVTPFWGIVQRVATPFVFAEGMKRVGSMLVVSCFTLAVILAPVVIYADQRTGETLRRLMLNEPIYYLPSNAHGS